MSKRFLVALLVVLGLTSSGFCFAKEEAIFVASYPEIPLQVTLLDRPCTGKLEKMIPKELLKELKKAEVVFRNQPVEACWMLTPKGNIGIVDELGDSGELSLKDFVRANRS